MGQSAVMGLQAKALIGAVAAVALIGAAFALYGWGKASGRQECAEQRAEAVSAARAEERAKLEARIALAEKRAKTERQRRERLEAEAERREDRLDEYLESNADRAAVRCLNDDELRLFNDGRSGGQ